MQRQIIIGMILVVVCATCSCKMETIEEKKVKDCSFTVLEQEEIPKELEIIIEEKKKEPFKLSFGEEGYLYIVQGYGAQIGGGYSIVVNQLYETENTISFETSLIGPKEQTKTTTETYPYIVVKMEYVDKSIVYE